MARIQKKQLKEVLNKINATLNKIAEMKVNYAVTFDELYASHEKVINIALNGYTFTVYYETKNFSCQYPLVKGVAPVVFWEKENFDCFCDSMINIAKV